MTTIADFTVTTNRGEELDLEAKGKLVRVTTKPLRWHWK